MKTLTRTIIALTALSMLAAAVAQAQTSRPAAPVLPATPSPGSVPTPATPTPPTPPTPPTLPSSGSVELAVANDLLRSVSFSSRSGGAGTVLVIPSEQTKTEDLLAINEDMSVMSRIFEKNLEQEGVTTVTGSIFVSRRDVILPLLSGSRGQIQSMYLQGFGALFLMKVDFPLTPPPEVKQEQPEIQEAEEGDPVWQEIRQEMYEPEKVDRRRSTGRQESKYEAQKVENLKSTLIKALKHAANIRSLKTDESVILTVVGKGDATGTTIAAARALPGRNQIVVQERTADGNTVTKMVTGTSIDDIGLSSNVILVIRTKKSDIDQFAKGDIDFEKFNQRVQLLTYPLLGGADGGNRDPFRQYYESYGSSSTGSYGSSSTGSSKKRR